MFTIKEIPIQERPRERFAKYPRDTIQTSELLAILLRTGSNNKSAITLAKELLIQYGSLKTISNCSIKELTSIHGIGFSKAISILAAFELGRRMNHEPFTKRIKLHSPEAIYTYIKDQLQMKTQEHLLGLYLSTKGELIQKEVLFIGTLNSSVIHPREIFKFAVIHSAASVILVHNHPSGDPTPSGQDKQITKRIYENSLMMDIELLDHIIVGRDKYVSFKEKGLI